MAEELVPRPTELVAAEAIVVLVAADPDLVLKLSHQPVVSQLLPLRAGVDHAGVRGLLDQLPISALEMYILTPSTKGEEGSEERRLKKVCQLGELKTTSSVHYTIKGFSVPRKPKITPTKKNQTQNAEDLGDGRLYVIRAKETSCGGRKVQGVKARVEKKKKKKEKAACNEQR